MFIGDLPKQGWKQQDFGLFDRLMQTHPTMIIEHYSGYLEGVDVDDCITRKNLYWQYQRKELIKTAKSEQNLTSSEQLPKSDIAKKDLAADSLTTEESEFMKTMEEIDVWYEAQMNQAKLEGEQLQKQSIALNLLQKNIPIETISEATGLTIDRLQQLQVSLENDRSN